MACITGIVRRMVSKMDSLNIVRLYIQRDCRRWRCRRHCWCFCYMPRTISLVHPKNWGQFENKLFCGVVSIWAVRLHQINHIQCYCGELHMEKLLWPGFLLNWWTKLENTKRCKLDLYRYVPQKWRKSSTTYTKLKWYIDVCIRERTAYTHKTQRNKSDK